MAGAERGTTAGVENWDMPSTMASRSTSVTRLAAIGAGWNHGRALDFAISGALGDGRTTLLVATTVTFYVMSDGMVRVW